MSANNVNQEKDDSVLAESHDDFQYEEVSLEDDWSLTEGEEDLEATVKAIQDRAEASASAAAAAPRAAPPAAPPAAPRAAPRAAPPAAPPAAPRAAPPAAAPSPNATSTSHQAEAVDDFLRNFLFQMGMRETLDCFQTEWTEMVLKGLVDTEGVGVVPEVYTENQRLDRELENAKLELEEYRLAASAGAETLAKVQKDRDFQRLKHKRVVQEKNRLIEEMRKLKVQCNNYNPAVKRINEKYQAVLKQIMLGTAEMDKALGQASGAQHNVSSCGSAGEEGEPSVKGTTHQ